MLNKKLIIPVLSSLVLATAIPAVNTEASVAKKTVVANYNNIKVNYNGSAVSVDPEPFIINGTTYIPLRAMGTLFNKNVTWDGGSYTINVSDKADTRTAALEAEIASLKSQIAAKDSTISSLREEIADLEDDDDDDDSDSIDDLESDIQDEYEDYFEDDYDVSLDISVDGDEDSVDIEIEVDSSEGDFDDIDDSDWEDLVSDIMDSVWDNDDFEEAEIDGTIYDTEEDEDLYDFLGNYDDEEDEDYYKEFDDEEID
ncbi:copper amine oxidase N-terminal domain-containing protein [Brevibacillus migulae]|uniref:copper amine oxidase N-terminal domain-containing protein n=1 Tax=Brevibacillus migulae TaxID=1644114 RepID=UPI00106E327C|nr:copper amine oxidase N-terminal domain-containing protein [Brevibacillus migulae]